MSRLTIVSGLGGKLPACFLVEAGEARILLDVGEGPEPGVRPNIEPVGKVDAIFISHAHEDHAAALDLAPDLGNPPVYATKGTWANIKNCPVPEERRRLLPLCGNAEIFGARVTTGRCGHAPGGVWLHFAVGGGFLYTGDWSAESKVYPFDMPPQSATVVLDASYGDRDDALDDQVAALGRMLGDGAVLPIPIGGRGPEMALRLVELGHVKPHLCPEVRRQAETIASGGDDAASPQAQAAIAALLRSDLPEKPDPKGITICGDSNAEGGLAAELFARWLGSTPFIFTGHVPKKTPAHGAIAEGRARWQRWNTHPRRSDNVRLARAVGARQVIPAFTDLAGLVELPRELAPAPMLRAYDIDLI